MSDTFSIRVDGQEIARVTGEVTCGKRVAGRTWHEAIMIDDLKILRIMHNGKPVAVFYVSAGDNVSVTKLEDTCQPDTKN